MFTTIQEKKVLFLLGVFILALASANLMGSKIISIFGISVSVGIFMYPFTFTVTDIIADVFGKKLGKQFVFIGMWMLVLLFGLAALSLAIPPAERFADQAAAYHTTFSHSLRFIFASLTAFAISQLHEIWIFNIWKKKTQGRWLWLRDNASTIVSQGIDTMIFMFIAFYHLTDKFTAGYVFELAITYWIFKAVFSVIDTPLVYTGVWWLKKGHTEHTEKNHNE